MVCKESFNSHLMVWQELVEGHIWRVKMLMADWMKSVQVLRLNIVSNLFCSCICELYARPG